ncbi:MAG: sensor histidine kinase [Actinobacteria bacterium]|nr:MAG: sensor histidine kinase [Actinomycetota bacterium]
MSQVLLGLLVLHEDLTYAGQQRAEAEAALRRIADERERLLEDRRQAVAARDQFLAVAAHELRTPLATLALLVDHLIASPPAPPGSDPDALAVHRRQLTMLKRQVDRLRSLVAEMLDVSRVTSTGLDLVPGPVDLRDVVQEVIDRFDPEIQQRRVSVSVDAREPVRGVWDAARVDQVVTNLVSNALKYGAGRPIEVSVRTHGPSALVVVSDHGVGIQDDEQGKIFAPFARAVAARHHAGLGLGLWIAQQIAEASGGRIKVDSRPAEGSTFTLELPL